MIEVSYMISYWQAAIISTTSQLINHTAHISRTQFKEPDNNQAWLNITTNYIDRWYKGYFYWFRVLSPTWGWSKSSLMLFLIEGDPSYQMLLTGSKKNGSQPKLSFFEISKIEVITVGERTLIVISQKWPFLEFQNLSSPTFFIQSSWNLI